MPTPKPSKAALARARKLFSVRSGLNGDRVTFRLGADYMIDDGNADVRRHLVNALALEFDAYAVDLQAAPAALSKGIEAALTAWLSISARSRRDFIAAQLTEAASWDSCDLPDLARECRAVAALLKAVGAAANPKRAPKGKR